MAISVTVNQVRKVAATNRIYVNFSDGTQREFENFQAVKDWAQDIDISAAQVRDLLQKLFARWYVLHDPTGATPSLIEGHTITLDLSAAANLVTVS